MGIQINPSDLYFRYPRRKDSRDLPKFSGKPDPAPFDRYDLYEVVPMFEAVMNAVGSRDQEVLQRAEEILDQLPAFINTREMVFDALVEGIKDFAEGRRRRF
jgi:hypothetical protein